MKTLVALMVLSLTTLAHADDGKFKDRMSIWSIDIPATSTVTQAEVECHKRQLELAPHLSQIAATLRAPEGKLQVRTDINLYTTDPLNHYYDVVCSLYVRSTDPQFGYRLVKGLVHKGKDRLDECLGDVNALNANPNILLAQFDDGTSLPFFERKCQAYGIEVGLK